MRRPNVLISGASVAGPALACFLARAGFAVTVVEIAPALRAGGYAVDFRGPTHLAALEHLGVVDELRALQTGGSPIRVVDEHDRTLLLLPGEVGGGEIEVRRADLTRVLQERSRDDVEYVFGDTVVALDETGSGVDVTFDRGEPRTFDLVIGADGMHSAVRRLAFPAEAQEVTHLGYYVAGWDVPNVFGAGAEALMYNVPGRMAALGGDPREPGRADALVVFASKRLEYDRHDDEQQKRIIASTYAEVGWKVPALLEHLDEASDLYFDSISRVDVDHWSSGRIGLIGDAACGATVGGMGTGTAVVSAYVLAGELAAARGDHRGAFERYERTVRGYARECQKGGKSTASLLAPRTRLGITLRNRLLNVPLLMAAMIKEGHRVSSTIDLPDYDLATT
ncbi:FAD-dependent monooxygenase [Pseudonocardia sp. TRM90224]|uniref:FAD-dependent monooxygenase n=1 Tax=Pseudonocardia sp. TRM90224 TaxID=2812678 RepID=UPI001E371237|nr:FAD-dependent monooxygenase [Pseudonocardia sp. TRM90224]